jgi:hypothetical protein
MVTALYILTAATACGGGSDPEGVVDPLPEQSNGLYAVDISGDWTGTCQLTICPDDVTFASLYMTRDEWTANITGPHQVLFLVKEAGEWHFKWDLEVNTNGDMVRQQWEVFVPEDSLAGDSFSGTYVHKSDLTGQHQGNISATRLDATVCK